MKAFGISIVLSPNATTLRGSSNWFWSHLRKIGFGVYGEGVSRSAASSEFHVYFHVYVEMEFLCRTEYEKTMKKPQRDRRAVNLFMPSEGTAAASMSHVVGVLW